MVTVRAAYTEDAAVLHDQAGAELCEDEINVIGIIRCALYGD